MFLLPCVASARHLTAEEALQRMQKSAVRHIAPLEFGNIKLVYDAEAYVFAQDSTAFYVLPADDALPAVIGYGNAPSESLPDAMKWWLSMMANSTAAEVYNHPKILPLLNTSWSQGVPYNKYCPHVNNANCPTGCVATATAQVLNYHRLPATHGFGRHAYAWNGQTLSFDYENTIFDWNNMLNRYVSGSYSEAEAEAVSDLMYAIGVGVEMEYAVNGSGSQTENIPKFLTAHMGVDKGVGCISRNYFSAQDWDNIIYGEISERRPVIYSGGSGSGAHCFVVDGYQSDGLYHINWGWGGSYDGYFLLSALAAAGGNYNNMQLAIVNLQAPTDDSQTYISVGSSYDFEYLPKYGIFAFYSEYNNAYKAIKYYGKDNLSYRPGVLLVGDEGEVFYLAGQQESVNKNDDNAFGFISVDLETIPADTYKAYPMVQPMDGAQWQPVPIHPDAKQYATLTKHENGAISTDTPEHDVDFKLRVTGISAGTDLVDGQPSVIRVSCYNTTPVPLSSRLMFRMTKAYATDVYTLTADEGEDWQIGLAPFSNAVFELTHSQWHMPGGGYRIQAFDADSGEPISGETFIRVGICPTEVQILPAEATMAVGEVLCFTANVLPEDSYDRSVYWTVNNTSIAKIDQEGNVTALSPGTTKVCAISNNGIVVYAPLAVVERESAIDEVESSLERDGEYYDLQGRRVLTPQRGHIYINNRRKIIR